MVNPRVQKLWAHCTLGTHSAELYSQKWTGFENQKTQVHICCKVSDLPK